MDKAKEKARIESMQHLDQDVIAHASERFDATVSAFLSRQLTQVRAQVLNVSHAPLNAFTVFPVQTEIAAGANTAIQYVYDMVGMAKIIANPADDLPHADILAEETSVKVKEIGAAYGYSVSDLENAAFANLNLTSMKAEAVRRAIDTKLNKIAWFGDDNAKITGFIGNANVSEYTLTADGTSSSTKFSAKTAEKQYRDVSNIIETIPENTEESEQANTMLFSPASYRALATTLYTSANGQTTQTVLEMLKANYPAITRWLKVSELKNADSTGTKDIAIAGYFDPSYIRFEIPVRFDQRPIQNKNLIYEIPCRAKTIGVTVFKPFCFTKAVGV